jgi:hypothetical protein
MSCVGCSGARRTQPGLRTRMAAPKMLKTGTVPSSSLDRDYPGDGSWRRKLDEGEDFNDITVSPAKRGGIDSQNSPESDAFSPASRAPEPYEEQIVRLEKRLKKNLPSEVRLRVEAELAALRNQRGKRDKSPVAVGGARRKIGDCAPGTDKPDLPSEKTKKYYNKAAPVNLHPKTITRMADWQNELDKRMREQEELNKINASNARSTSENPLESFQKVVESVVNGIASALGMKEENSKKEERDVMPQARPVLPPQTFSRRL